REQRRELRDGGIRGTDSEAVGRHFCFQYAWSVSGDARGAEMVAAAAWKGSGPTRGENHQHGIARGTATLGEPRTLLFVESRAAHADESDGQSAGAGDCSECRRSGDD